jgi:hypothetical protein
MTQYTVPKKKAHFFEATVRRAVSNRSLSLGFVGRVDERVEVRFWRASTRTEYRARPLLTVTPDALLGSVAAPLVLVLALA